MRTPAVGLVAAAAVAALAMTAGAAPSFQRERPRTNEFQADDVLDRLMVEARYMEGLERCAGQLQASAATKGPLDRDTLRLLLRLATISHASERQVGERLFPTLLPVARSSLREDDPLLLDVYLRSVAWARISRSRQEAGALLAATQALTARHPPRNPIVQQWVSMTEVLITGPGDWSKRIDRLRAALRTYARYGLSPSEQEATSLTWLAWNLDRAGRRDEVPAAIRDARRSIDAIGVPDGYLSIVLDTLQAENLIQVGRWGEALPFVRRLARNSEASRDRELVGVFARRGELLSGYDLLAVDAVQHGRGDEAWRYLERFRAPHHADMQTIGAWRRLDPSGFSRYASAQDRLLAARARATGVASEAGFAWDTTHWRATMDWVHARLAVLRMENEFLQRFVPRGVSLEAAQRALGPRDALVGWLEVNIGGDPGPFSEPHLMYRWVYVLRADRPIAWVPIHRGVTREDETFRRVREEAPIATVVRASRWPTPVDDDPELRARLRRWSRMDLDPALPHLAGVDRLVFAETRFPVGLHILPDGRYVGERFDIAVVPSGQALAMAGTAAPESPRERTSALILSAARTPAPSTYPDGSRVLRTSFEPVDDAALRAPELPFAAREARDVASLFDEVTAVSGEPESLRRLDGLLSAGVIEGADVVHIAAHAISDDEPEACAFTLSGTRSPRGGRDAGLLDAEEIFRSWRLSASLLTLSGCDTGTAAGMGGREWYGFVPIASAIGAKNVLASMWPVDDRATSILMKRFYENYTGRYAGRRGAAPPGAMTPERALREAQAYLRQYTEGRKKPYAHPAYWGSFELVHLHGAAPRRSADER